MSLINYFCTVIFVVEVARAELMKINSKFDDTVFKYREDASSERKLKECKRHDACNVVHQRFWLPNVVERICRCPNGFECPWSGGYDDYSMMLNNRSLLKFCEPVKKNVTCTRKQQAAVIRGKINGNFTEMVPHGIRINCNCPKTHYWKLQKYDFGDDNSLFQIFRCQKQVMCDTLDFCGYIRADYFSAYYRCTCPEGNLCIPKNRETESAQELIYTGQAYEAFCLRWK